MPEKHTGQNLAKCLQAAQNRWCFKNSIAVSDNAANEIKAFNTLGWNRISHFAIIYILLYMRVWRFWIFVNYYLSDENVFSFS